MENETKKFEETLQSNKESKYILRLYVTGTTPQSLRAIANIKKVCEEHLAGHYELNVIDIYQDGIAIDQDQIVAAPTLIKQFPEPFRRLVGDMSNTERVLSGLGISAGD